MSDPCLGVGGVAEAESGKEEILALTLGEDVMEWGGGGRSRGGGHGGDPTWIPFGPRGRRAAKRHKRRQKHRQGPKRLRSITQPAPSNNNEFLMQEHDHLCYHGEARW